MTEVETELDSRYDDIDVDSILARCQRQGPLTFSRKRCLYQAPEFIKRLPSTEEVEEGSTVSFACKVVGFPAPAVTWFKDDDILTSESRAKTDFEDSGIHSIKIQDVSKCDSGIYKIRASNLEGSSKSMLYISVKAKSKRRNKKKKKSGTVACAPLFSTIIERVAEEQKETLEFQLQPDSPLTPLYCTISRKAPVMWPAFLGDWAYNEDDVLHKGEIEDLGAECDDVFGPETGVIVEEGMSCVSSACAQMKDSADEIDEHLVKCIHNDTNNDDVINSSENDEDGGNLLATDDSNHIQDSDKNDVTELKKPVNLKDAVGVDERNTMTSKTKTKEADCDILNNNDNTYANKENIESLTSLTERSVCDAKPHQIEQRQIFCDPNNVSTISVHRSYAKDDTKSSVARRSPSPFSRTNLMSYTHNGIDLHHDTTTLQNLNNERILRRMNQNIGIYNSVLSVFRSVATSNVWDDGLEIIILLLCGSTFLALCFDLYPSTFMFDIVIAMAVFFVLSYVLDDK